MKKRPPLRFSFSKFSTYEKCPMAYKFKYVDKIAQQPRSYFSLGSAVHKALELFHAHKRMTSKQLVSEFCRFWDATTWQEKGFQTALDASATSLTGVAMLHEYYNKYAKVVPRKAYAVERCADVEVDGLLIRYIVDRIDVRPSKKIWLIDYKTGKHVPSSAEQLWFYQKIAKYDRTLRPLFNTGAYLDTLMFLHVNTCTEYPVDPASPKALKSLWTRVLASAQGVRDSRFPTNRGSNCKWCDYAQQCSNGNVSDTTDKF